MDNKEVEALYALRNTRGTRSDRRSPPTFAEEIDDTSEAPWPPPLKFFELDEVMFKQWWASRPLDIRRRQKLRLIRRLEPLNKVWESWVYATAVDLVKQQEKENEQHARELFLSETIRQAR
jgi:hypothetical protein